MAVLNSIILLAIFLILPIFLGGIIRKTRAMCQNRKGPPILQNFFDLQRLWYKKPIDNNNSATFAEISPVSIFVFGIAIYSIVVFEWTSFLIIPFFLALQRVLLVGFAMETGSSFGGLGTSREILLSITGEPIMILSIVVAQSKLSVDFNYIGIILGILFLGAFLIVILAELSKPPFDDPRTHLELTMVHEAMLLEASGRTLAYFEATSQLKIATFFVLLFRIGFQHFHIPIFGIYSDVVQNILLIIGTFFLSSLIGYWEAISVRRKWIWIPEIMGMTFLFLLVLGTLVKI
jgi:formate hydrogenlyase subunit 4